jgi:hypothetical protein
MTCGDNVAVHTTDIDTDYIQLLSVLLKKTTGGGG